MFFKELLHDIYCLVINVHLVCLSAVHLSNSFILSCRFLFVNNFFQLFFNSFPLFQRRPLKLAVFRFLLLSFATAWLDYHSCFYLSITFLKLFYNFKISRFSYGFVFASPTLVTVPSKGPN